MAVKIKYRGDTLDIFVTSTRIEGKNEIFQTLVEDNTLPKEVENLVFDLNEVDYVNSLGIAEFISIHRYFSSVNQGRTRMRFVNVEPKIAQLFEMVELGNLSEVQKKDR